MPNEAELEFGFLLLDRCFSVMRQPGDKMYALSSLFTSVRRRQTNLLRHVLFQMSPLPVCVLSLLPCGAHEVEDM